MELTEAKPSQAYCIKENYRPNLKPASLDRYWNPSRVKTASTYQYHVYEKARQLLLRHRLNSVLDVGSGPGSKIKELIWPHCRDVVLVDHPMIAPLAKQTLPMAEVVGVDLEQALVDLGKRFQLVICSDVIEHLTDPDPCVTFIRRHLASSGLAVISTPERDVVRGHDCDRCAKPEHVREWNKSELARYLQTRGLTIVEHLLFPLSRVSRITMLASQLLPRALLPSYWYGNQVAICSVLVP